MIEVHRFGARGLWGIYTSIFSPVLRAEAKATPGMAWDPGQKAWVGYADAVRLVIDRSRARGLRIVEPRLLDPGAAGLIPIARQGLREYQTEGVDFLIAKAAEGALLADDMGLGKTAQAIRAARALRAKTVIVCPSFVRGVWADELEKWWPDVEHLVEPTGTKPSEIPPDAQVVVIHYDILYAWVEAISKWGLQALILDEAQYCQGATSRRTKACAVLGAQCAYRIALTGTPMANRPADLWAVAETISPGRFGKFFAYGMRYCAGRREQVTPERAAWIFDGASNMEELKARIHWSPTTPSGWMLRRVASDVAVQLPTRQRQTIQLEGGKVRYDAAALGSHHQLRRALEAASDQKVPAVVDLVVDHLRAGKKVVVGSHRKELARRIADEVSQKMPVAPTLITGEVPAAKRHAAIKLQPAFICCTFDSTQVGIDLSFASVGVVAEFDYRPSVIAQWEARFGRHGGKNALIQYCSARGTVDDLIRRAILQKLDKIDQTIGKVDQKLRTDLEELDGASGLDRLKALAAKLMADA